MIIYKLTRAGAHPRPPGCASCAARVFLCGSLATRLQLDIILIERSWFCWLSGIYAKLALRLSGMAQNASGSHGKLARFAWKRINASWYVDAYCADVFANEYMGMKWIPTRISKYGIRISKYESDDDGRSMPYFRASFDFGRATRKFCQPSIQAGKSSILQFWFDAISKIWFCDVVGAVKLRRKRKITNNENIWRMVRRGFGFFPYAIRMADHRKILKHDVWQRNLNAGRMQSIA